MQLHSICTRFTLLIGLLLPAVAGAQDLTGLWQGSLRAQGSTLHFELAISGSDNNFSGYGLTIYLDNAIENIGIKSVKLVRKGSRITFEDDKQVYNNYTSPAKRVKIFANLSLQRKGMALTLEGTFKTRSLDLRHPEIYEGTVFLQKQADYTASRLMRNLDSLGLEAALSLTTPRLEVSNNNKPSTREVASAERHNPPSFERSHNTKETKNDVPRRASPALESTPGRSTIVVKEPPAAHLALRKTEVLQTVAYTSDSLVLAVYDNGEVDGDTVSVVCNGAVILPMQGLSSKPVKTVILTSQLTGASSLLILYAENLGSIPPNTGLLVIQDGAKKYQIRFAGDLKKNAAIVLKRAE